MFRCKLIVSFVACNTVYIFAIYDPMQLLFWSEQSSIKGGVRSATCKHSVQANQGSFVAVLPLLFGGNHYLRLFPGLCSGVLQCC